MFNLKTLFSSPVVMAVAMTGAFFVGRSTVKPTQDVKIVEVDKTTEIHHEAQIIEKKMDLEEIKSLFATWSQNAKRHVAKKKTTIENPDGSKKTIEEEDDKSSVDTDSTLATNNQLKLKSEELESLKKDHTLLQEKLKLSQINQTVAGLPTWNVGVLAGVAMDATSLSIMKAESLVPGVPSALFLGAYVERKLIWDVYLQAWVNTRGHTGLSLRKGFE